MKHTFCLGLLLGLALVSCLQAQTATSPPSRFDLAEIDAYIAKEVEQKGLVGLSVAIMRDGEIVFAKGYGRRSLEPAQPVEPETSFAVGSVTKQFTCACVLLLHEEGRLSVHDPVARFFPELTRAADITLLDLMNHTSGFPDYYPLDFLDRRMLKPISQSDLLATYAGGKLDFEPGSRFSYSNTGYILLGAVVEKVTGRPFGEFLGDRILKPLKLSQSAFDSPAELKNAAKGYNGFALGPPEPAPPEADGWIDAAGGLWASASDLLRWDLALVTGKVLRPASYELMTAPRKLSSGKISTYGCGLGTIINNGEVVLQHTGAVSGFAAYNAVLPRTKSALVILSNTEHISVAQLRSDLFNLLLKDISEQDGPEVPKVAGPPAKEVVLAFFKQMQKGEIDRTNLSEEFNHYLTAERVASAAPRLRALGDPDRVEADAPNERGGLEVTRVTLTFKDAKLRAALYRDKSGVIMQLLFYGG